MDPIVVPWTGGPGQDVSTVLPWFSDMLLMGEYVPPVVEPDDPTSLDAVASGWNRIDLSWVDGAGTSIIYVERSLTGGGSGFAEIGSVLAGVQTYADLTGEASTEYFYRVRGWNSAGYSDYSGEDHDTTGAVSGGTFTPGNKGAMYVIRRGGRKWR
jgi:hypothetical protein